MTLADPNHMDRQGMTNQNPKGHGKIKSGMSVKELKQLTQARMQSSQPPGGGTNHGGDAAPRQQQMRYDNSHHRNQHSQYHHHGGHHGGGGGNNYYHQNARRRYTPQLNPQHGGNSNGNGNQSHGQNQHSRSQGSQGSRPRNMHINHAPYPVQQQQQQRGSAVAGSGSGSSGGTASNGGSAATGPLAAGTRTTVPMTVEELKRLTNLRLQKEEQKEPSSSVGGVDFASLNPQNLDGVLPTNNQPARSGHAVDSLQGIGSVLGGSGRSLGNGWDDVDNLDDGQAQWDRSMFADSIHPPPPPPPPLAAGGEWGKTFAGRSSGAPLAMPEMSPRAYQLRKVHQMYAEGKISEEQKTAHKDNILSARPFPELPSPEDLQSPSSYEDRVMAREGRSRTISQDSLAHQMVDFVLTTPKENSKKFFSGDQRNDLNDTAQNAASLSLGVHNLSLGLEDGGTPSKEINFS